MSFGEPHIHYMVCDSTNDRARRLAATGFPSGTIVTADAQRSGRGRSGRSWEAKAGKASSARRCCAPSRPTTACSRWRFRRGRRGGRGGREVECQVKWPNDVWIDGRKVAGVLIEADRRTAGR